LYLLPIHDKHNILTYCKRGYQFELTSVKILNFWADVSLSKPHFLLNSSLTTSPPSVFLVLSFLLFFLLLFFFFAFLTPSDPLAASSLTFELSSFFSLVLLLFSTTGAGSEAVISAAVPPAVVWSLFTFLASLAFSPAAAFFLCAICYLVNLSKWHFFFFFWVLDGI
jgi:hypothetical protein